MCVQAGWVRTAVGGLSGGLAAKIIRSGAFGNIFSPWTCSVDVEMSGLVEIEMSSFGAASPTLVGDPATERGDAKVEHARRRSADGAAPGARRRADSSAASRKTR